ncbi:unnamed protein product [Urochloa decumbens]|uniref:Uncharacterized protein n=1 Tax=Urochloa decumbens TaxID=240449 RepID=A0ABC8XIM7_9POAL
MASSSVSPSSSPNPVGLWFCQISSGLQGRWQGDGANSNGAGGRAIAADTARARSKDGGEPARRACRRDDAMPEATVYLLLDRFAPS